MTYPPPPLVAPPPHSVVQTHLFIPKVPEPDRAAISACAKSGPKLGEHVQFFRMKRDRNKGFYSEKCQLEASIAMCFEWVGYRGAYTS